MTATLQEPAQLNEAQAGIAVSGIIEIGEGHAFVRTSGYRRSPADVYVSAGQIRQYGLRNGDMVEGAARAGAAGRGKYRPLTRVDTVSGMPPGLAKSRPHFDDLTPIYPSRAAWPPPRCSRLAGSSAPRATSRRAGR
jgi:transcription termination factor Rho